MSAPVVDEKTSSVNPDANVPQNGLNNAAEEHFYETAEGSATTERSTEADADTEVPTNIYAEDKIEAEDNTNSNLALKKINTASSVDSREAQDTVTRILSQTSSRVRRRDSLRPLPKMGGGKDYPPELGDRENYRVDFDGVDDPIHPHNWPLKKKLLMCFALGFTTFVTAWGSSSFASAVPFVAAQYGVIDVVAILGVSFYVLGFASGPVLWAPLSETYGRKTPLIISIFGLTVFTFACATAKDLQTILITRFFGGFIGAAPLVVVAAAFADMFNNESRGTALSIFSGMVFTGPIVAPVVGGFISYSYLGWRWNLYLTGIMGSAATVLDILIYEESYHPIILVNKARELRRRTGNWGIYAPQENIELDINDLVQKNLTRPIKMLFTEPILLLITIYTAFVYGLLYLLLEAFPIVFAGKYHFHGGVAELPYLALAVGQLIFLVLSIKWAEPRYNRAIRKNNGKPLPEERLPPMIIAALVFTIGIFWFCWTGNYPEHVHWIAPTLAGLFIGFGLMGIFMPAVNYLVDTYLLFAASALAANTFLRSSFGAAFPLFAGYMFNNMGVNWAGTLLGCVAVVLLPVPVLFYKYGKSIRRKSKYAFDLN